MRQVWLAAFALTGCVAGASAPPAEAVRVAPVAGVTWPAARGETALDVRAVARDAQGREAEVAGARCNADSALFAAEFTAPARLLLPDFGASSPEVSVTCRLGDAVGRAVARPDWAWSGGLGGWPVVGVSVGTGMQSGVGVGLGWYGGGTGAQAGYPATRYPALRVAME